MGMGKAGSQGEKGEVTIKTAQLEQAALTQL
jgi:hypothetical protein